MTEWWQKRIKSCKSTEQLFMREVNAAEVEDLVNSLRRAGWHDVIYDRHGNPDEGAFVAATYTVTATRDICECSQ